MPDYKHITVETTGRTARATVKWPGGVGSWDPAIAEDIEHLVNWVEDTAPCDVLVFRPEGEATSITTPPNIDQCQRWEKLVVRLDRLECVSVAAIDGACIRSWMQLALACDLRVATRRSSLQILELKEGYLPGMNTFRIAKYLGLGPARRLVFTGAPVLAVDAAAMGLIDEVAEGDDLDAGLARLLASLEPVRPVPARLARRLLNESFSTAFEDFMGQYLASQNKCLGVLAKQVQNK